MARDLFIRDGYANGYSNPFESHRTCKCLYTRISKSVEVYRNAEHKSVHYGGLMSCGSVWACPVCTAKIQERRRGEIKKAIDKAYIDGHKVVMVTLTFPHMAFQSLDDLIKRQAVALSKMRSGEPWKRVQRWAGYKGLIRSLELTHGENGWHPHTHELWIVDKHCNAEELKEKILKRWESACIRAGLLTPEKAEAFQRRAVDIKDKASCSDYLAKQDSSRHWGADREVAKASTKVGKASGKHPFQFLVAHAEGDEKAGKLWLEYAKAMKGKRQLFWSKGLKKWAGLDDKTDEELAAEQDEEASLLGKLDDQDWALVLENNARSLVLDIGEEAGWDGITVWLGAMRKQREAKAKTTSVAPVAPASSCEPQRSEPQAPVRTESDCSRPDRSEPQVPRCAGASQLALFEPPS